MSDTVVTTQTIVNTAVVNTTSVSVIGSTQIQVATAGTQGPTGQGVPTGGSTGQALVKNSGTNFDTLWQTIVSGVSNVFGRTGAITAQNGDYNIGQISGVGTAATKAASNNSDSTLASISGAVTANHLAVFADTSGTIKDGGAVPTGTVTTVSVATANGFSGTVANATTTPAITLKSTLSSGTIPYVNSSGQLAISELFTDGTANIKVNTPYNFEVLGGDLFVSGSTVLDGGAAGDSISTDGNASMTIGANLTVEQNAYFGSSPGSTFDGFGDLTIGTSGNTANLTCYGTGQFGDSNTASQINIYGADYYYGGDQQSMLNICNIDPDTSTQYSVASIEIGGTYGGGTGPKMIFGDGSHPAMMDFNSFIQCGTDNNQDFVFVTGNGAGGFAERLRLPGYPGTSATWYCPVNMNANNLVLDTTTGTQIGTATNQKLAFYGKAPVVQPNTTGTTTGFTAGSGTTVVSGSTFTGNTGSTAYTIGDIVHALKILGILAA